ncbi:hypothetical protein KQH51_01530 [bacterium]|nr:hypothetical protein [bacterium]MCB2201605.1 hypothetical protein [bacterium]
MPGDDAFDEKRAQDMVGKEMLVGLTICDHEDNFLRQEQFCGTVIRANRKDGVVLFRRDTGKEYKLPPDLQSVKDAPPGTYRLRSTGEEIENPDLISTWVVHEPPPSESDSVH